MLNSKLKIILATSAFLLVSVLMVLLAIFNSNQTLIVSFDESKYSSVVLYRGSNDKSESTIAPKTKEIVEESMQSGKEYFIPRGGYFLVANGKENYESQYQPILLNSSKREVKLGYSYTQKYLDKLSQESISGIKNAIYASNEKIEPLYDIQKEQVMEKGEWAIAALVFKGDGFDLNRDTLKVILKKENSNWKVVCKPMISISKYDCSAPRDVLNKASTIDIVTFQPLMPNYTIHNKYRPPE